MRVNDLTTSQKLVEIMSDLQVRRLVSATIAKAKSAAELSEELTIPIRSIYRYIEQLCELGLLCSERSALISKGGKYTLYRSLVKTVTVIYDGDKIEVDLIPNEGLLGKFMRFWTYMGRR